MKHFSSVQIDLDLGDEKTMPTSNAPGIFENNGLFQVTKDIKRRLLSQTLNGIFSAQIKYHGYSLLPPWPP